MIEAPSIHRVPTAGSTPPEADARERLTDAVYWQDAEIEQFLSEGSGADLNCVMVWVVLAACGLSMQDQCTAKTCGIDPWRAAARTLWRLGWKRIDKGPAGELRSSKWARGETPRVPRPGFEAVLRRRVEALVSSPQGLAVGGLTTSRVAAAIDADGLICARARQLIEVELARLGWQRRTYNFPALRRSVSVWERQRRPTPSLPSGSQSK